MKKICFFLLLNFFSVLPGAANGQNFLPDFLGGKFVVIGRLPDAADLFSATITIKSENEKLIVTRTVGEKSILCQAEIADATGDQVPVLRLQWREKNTDFEGTYQIHSDLDNYPRLSGYIYKQDGSSKQAGLEAWFSDHGQLVR